MFRIFLIVLPLILMGDEKYSVSEVSEAIGHLIGKNLETLGLEFDLDAVVRGLQEESEGKSSPLNEEECVQAIAILQEEKMEATVAQGLEEADAISNGDQIKNDEDHPFPAADSAKRG